MQEIKNLNQEKVNKLVKTFPLQPLFNGVYITVNKMETDGNLVLSDNILSDEQYVIASGEHSVVKSGQKILIDIEKMMVPVKTETSNAYETVMQVKVDLLKLKVTYLL